MQINRVQYEIDFVVNRGYKRYYIQSAFAMPDREKVLQEERPFLKIKDSFKKIIIVKEDMNPYYTEEGILVMGVFDFLLDENSLENNFFLPFLIAAFSCKRLNFN